MYDDSSLPSSTATAPLKKPRSLSCLTALIGPSPSATRKALSVASAAVAFTSGSMPRPLQKSTTSASLMGVSPSVARPIIARRTCAGSSTTLTTCTSASSIFSSLSSTTLGGTNLTTFSMNASSLGTLSTPIGLSDAPTTTCTDGVSLLADAKGALIVSSTLPSPFMTQPSAKFVKMSMISPHFSMSTWS